MSDAPKWETLTEGIVEGPAHSQHYEKTEKLVGAPLGVVFRTTILTADGTVLGVALAALPK